MAVYTEVTQAEAQTLMTKLSLGGITFFQGITGGIENTNYFVSTDHGEFVLTLFERLSAEQLPYYLRLMQHLATNGVLVPEPRADQEGRILHQLCAKPCAVVDKLKGKSNLAPEMGHCEAVARMLAKMHLVGQDFPLKQANLRGLNWWNETTPIVLPYVNQEQASLLRASLREQNEMASSVLYQGLPRGPIHADLFRDNVMFENSRITGFFDFYFAGEDAWLFDIAVCLNDWCVHLDTGQPDSEKADSFLSAYQSVRPMSPAELELLPVMLRGAALRFWLSRLWDFYLPRPASQLKAHDPTHFERILRQRS
jgi:homoserine kinase type II